MTNKELFASPYVSPVLSVVECEVEAGFSLSNVDVTLPDFEDENSL